jgi:hypothetical protein
MGGVSSDLRMIHNDFIYSIDLDSTPLEKRQQTALYVLDQTIQAFEALETEMFPEESEDVKLLNAQITELQKSNEALTLNLNDNREFIKKLELQIKGNG